MSTDNQINMEVEPEEEPFGLGCALEMFVEVEEVYQMIEDLKNIYADKSLTERAYERFNFIISQYIEQPHLLDSHLNQLLEKCVSIIRNESSMELKHCVFKYMFIFVNVRGYKVIVRQLPHEVSDFEVTLKLLEDQNPLDTETWTTRYILLLWLSIIVMIPFHLSRFDGFSGTETIKKTVMSRVLDIIKCYIIVPDKCRDAAAYLSSRFITRSDVKEQHLSSYLDWAISMSFTHDNVFMKQGTLFSVAIILKSGKREDLLPHARRLLQWIINDDIKQNAGTNVQKLVYKIIQRIGLIFLPPRIATWRYQRGNRSLAANLSGGDGTSSTQAESETEENTEDDIEVPDEVEEVIDQLIQGLRCNDGVVRWSAAKGVGRVTGRLPHDLADEVVGSILELFNPREGDGAWHGGSLALAELGRRGLLLPRRLPEVVPVVLRALVYDEPRGYSSVGSHIRDAACYVCWSFARAYDKEVLRPFVNDIASTLLTVACYDREINCRRAASASFQENVGRQGTFPHGIDILTVADFFAVSVRHNSYLNISVYIAQFEEYTIPLIDHLLNRKVDHWDSAIRELTAKALHNLTPKATDYMTSVVLPKLFEKTDSIDLNSRHGSVLAIGEIVYSLSLISKEQNKQVESLLGSTLIDKIKNLVPKFREKFYFRGLGGELMRQACCDFIHNCSSAALRFETRDASEDWLNLINECISYNVPSIQIVAITALPVLLTQYFSSKETASEQHKLVQNYIHELLQTNQQEIRMGHALALGALPDFILKPNFTTIVNSLIESIKITPSTLKWAESRRNAIKALTTISITMSNEIGKIFVKDVILKIYDVFFEGLKDYTQDKRGDVGAWIREASVVGLQTLTFKVAERDPSILNKDLVTNILAGVAQQAVEKIDRTRALAGKVFFSFLHNDAVAPHIHHYDQIIKIFVKEECDDLNWNSAADTFPRFVELIQFPPYTYNVMLGIICSVGGLTETLVKNSSASLFSYIKKEENLKGVDEINRLCDTVYMIFKDYQKVDRVTLPMFRFLDKLFSSGCINLVIEDANSGFAKKILKLILVEIGGCKDVHKLVCGINVLAQFVQIQNETCQSALVQLSILLCHRQTYIRKTTASVLYESLLVYGDSANFNTDNIDEIMNVLSSTNWEDPVEIVKPIRNKLCDLMGIRVPVLKAKPQ